MSKIRFGIAFWMLLLVGLSLTQGATAKTTITFLSWDGEKSPITKGVEMFEAANPDIDVELMVVPRAEYDQKIMVMAAGGVDMDVFYVPENPFKAWAQMGWLYDITDNLRKDGIDDDFLPAEKVRSTVNGRWYGVGLTWNIFQLFYNPSMLNEAGVPLPANHVAKTWNWSQFVDATRKLIRVKPDGIIERWGAQFPPNFQVLSSLLFSNNTGFVDETGRLTLDNPRSVEVFDAINDLFNVRKLARNAGSGGLLNKVAAMTFTGSWELGLTFKGTGFTPSVGTMPAFKIPAAYVFGPYHGMYANTKHPLEAWRLLKFLISEEYASLWISEGVWTPTRKSFMSLSKLQKMTNPTIHPAKYLDETMSVISQVGRAIPSPIGWEKALPIFTQAISRVWHGESSSAPLLPDIARQMSSVLADAQAGK